MVKLSYPKTILEYSKDLREFCGFTKVPDASKITRFKQVFIDDLQVFFDRLVDLTEPILQEIDAEKASMSVFDTTGLEAYVTEFLSVIFSIIHKQPGPFPEAFL